jgi:hypothetical protein
MSACQGEVRPPVVKKNSFARFKIPQLEAEYLLQIGGYMKRNLACAAILFLGISLAPLGRQVTADEQALAGYSAESSRTER